MQISAGWGGWPRWRGDGKEILYRYFRNPSALMSARLQTETRRIEVAAPAQVIPLGGFASGRARAWDVTADGQRFLASGLVGPYGFNHLTVLVN